MIEAQLILFALLDEYDSMERTGELDMPEDLWRSSRAYVYEELAELGGENAKIYAGLAYDDLSKDEWFSRLEPKRLERLKQQREE